ncbi:hypothetical protein QYE76_047284 [Lolium multiflorum]|uniref:CCHC-type domain-containing protein n=1 Tax=Lolium multiflorum TaxID=4521 RepID=A0AAD8TQ05_LOLMU|nr:hypothetical protein QYE76_047284 [Lolium multiflorum]
MKPKNGPKPDAECYYCKEKGHWKRNCSKYLADLKSGLVKKKKEVSWASSKQCTVAKSSTESEYIAASEASSEAVWTKRFIVELGVVPSALEPLVIYCDNMGAIANAQEPRSHKRLKHIKLRYHSIREYIEDGERSSAEFSTATDTTPSSVGFKRSYYFRCPLGEVDVVFINNRTCDRVRRCCPFVAPVIKIFYALCKRQVNVYRSNKSLIL